MQTHESDHGGRVAKPITTCPECGASLAVAPWQPTTTAPWVPEYSVTCSACGAHSLTDNPMRCANTPDCASWFGERCDCSPTPRPEWHPSYGTPTPCPECENTGGAWQTHPGMENCSNWWWEDCRTCSPPVMDTAGP